MRHIQQTSNPGLLDIVYLNSLRVFFMDILYGYSLLIFPSDFSVEFSTNLRLFDPYPE